jgi:vacuolar-type H+-ATPase subunit E/Vma4
MADDSLNSTDGLCAEILATARRESEAILERAKGEASSLLDTASAEAKKTRGERRAAAQAEGSRRTELILATVAVETIRLRSAHIESLLESVRQEVRRRLMSQTLDAREIVVALAVAAVQRMWGVDFTLIVGASQQSKLGDNLASAIAERAGKAGLHLEVAADPGMNDAGVVLRSADGLQIWDNRLLERLERMWPELRCQIAARASLLGEDHSIGGGA